jgi:hypothetical protein
MSYPQGQPGGQLGGPQGGPSYQPTPQQQQQPTTQFSAPTQQFGRIGDPEPAADGPSKLPAYLTAAVAVLGLLVYLSYFAPQFTISASDFPGVGQISGSSLGLGLAVVTSVIAALLAGVSLLPKQRNHIAIAAVAAVLGFLLVISEVVNKPVPGATVDWGLYLVIAFSLLQAATSVVVLLFDAGILTPPVPRPRYEQQPQHYGRFEGQYPGSYYGQPQGGPQHGGPQQPQQQRPGYPTPYPGSSGGYPSTGPTTGGFPATSPGGPPTPPTGYPTYGQPPASNTPTTQQPTTPHQSSPSSQPGSPS